ncbi:hypothetical protein ABZ890_11875 [Streptomyces sp. NPDC046984]|uniref:hypothetical protein n=1 Tax=Streptomyces sp. NPDC046984 TaxID=3155138 RepID=UPI0033FC9752
MKITHVWKAVVAGIAAGAAATGTAVQDGHLTLAEGITIVLAMAGGYGVTWRVPNSQPDER